MSVFVIVLNMLADLCPHGMLPMAYGVAAMGGTGLGPAFLVTALSAAGCGYTLFSLGRSYHASGTTEPPSLRAVWSAVIGTESSWIASALVMLLCAGCCVFYSAFIGDLFTAVAQTVFPDASFLTRPVCLGLLTLCPLLPLCLMSNLSALQYSSVGGLGGILYVVLFVIIRCADGSYQEGGKFFNLIEESVRPRASGLGLWSAGKGMMVLMNMTVIAFLIHYNGVKYFTELKQQTNSNFRKAVSFSMLGSLAVFLSMMTFGSKTFGLNAMPLILNNYCKSEDPLATIARVATGVAILSGYPLMFSGLKEGAMPLAASAADSLGMANAAAGLRSDPAVAGTTAPQASVAVAILALITQIAFNVSEEDVGLVLGIVGAVLGSQLGYVVPALLNLKLFASGKIPVAKSSWEPALNRFLIAFGFAFAGFGTYATIAEHAAHGH